MYNALKNKTKATTIVVGVNETVFNAHGREKVAQNATEIF